MKKKLLIAGLALAFSLSIAACSLNTVTTAESSAEAQTSQTVSEESTVVNQSYNTGSSFTDRDLEQTVDTTDATTIQVKDNEDISITGEGTYVLTGTASEVTVRIDADDDAKVQLVLDRVSITNTDSPCIYVVSADKVLVTTVSGSENTLKVTGEFQPDGDTNTDAVIFSKDDLVLNGEGTLNINSTKNAVSCKDDLKITGGTYVIDCVKSGFEANDSILMSDGNITIKNCNDGLHAENEDDDTLGYITISGGTVEINAADDGIHATSYLTIEDGSIKITAAEGMEATVITINEGTLDISASDDGINAAKKSSSYTPSCTINGGEVTISMGSGDTDAIDSNGNLYINGGTLNITAQSPFDYDGDCEYTGGTLIVNGEETDTITNQFMGGGGFGGNGGPDGMGNPDGRGGFGH